MKTQVDGGTGELSSLSVTLSCAKEFPCREWLGRKSYLEDRLSHTGCNSKYRSKNEHISRVNDCNVTTFKGMMAK